MPKTRVLTDEQEMGRPHAAEHLGTQRAARAAPPIRLPASGRNRRAPGWRRPDPSSLIPGAVWAAAVVAGSAILFGLPSPMHRNAPAARAAIETLIATAALVSAGLLLLSFQYGRRRSDLLLFTALSAVGLTDLLFSALPALTGSTVLEFGSGPQVACDALAAIAFAAAAFSPDGSLPSRLRPLCIAGGVAMAIVALASGIVVIAGQFTFSAASVQSGVGAAAQHPVLLVEAIFSSAVLLAAGVAFLSRGERDARLLAGASYLLAASRLQYLALAAMAPDWVTARDGLRLAAYALLAVAALTRYEETRRKQTAATLAAERNRIARDLHDGLAQDLAYIALQGQRLSNELGAEHPLTLAARRAVAASREVIVDLAASTASSTDAAIRDVADELAARFGIDIDISVLDAAPELASNELDPVRREHVVRIVREAVVNAARHGAARHVAVVFDRGGDQLKLRVSDDGQGVGQTKLHVRNGHGLHMMRARAAALGGAMTARRRREGGVEIEVTFPCTREAGESR